MTLYTDTRSVKEDSQKSEDKMTTFPQTQNGWVDHGTQIKSTVGQKCPNCGSPRYMQTISTENCPDCGLQCNYWGGGANDVYQNMINARDERQQEYLDDKYGKMDLALY